MHRLQMCRHAVEALGERAELVGRRSVHARAQIATLDARGGLLQATDGLQNEEIPHVQEHRSAEDDEDHHRYLNQVQQRGPTGHVSLDPGDERIDVGGEGRGIVAQSCQRGLGRGHPAVTETIPIALYHRELLLCEFVPRHEQGPLDTAATQEFEAGIELRAELRQRRLLAGAHVQRHSVRLHAHAARFVHSRGAAIELR